MSDGSSPEVPQPVIPQTPGMNTELTDMVRDLASYKEPDKSQLDYLKIQRQPLFNGITPEILETTILERQASDAEVGWFRETVVSWHDTVRSLRKESKISLGAGVYTAIAGPAMTAFFGAAAVMGIDAPHKVIGTVAALGMAGITVAGVRKAIREYKGDRKWLAGVKDGRYLATQALEPTQAERDLAKVQPSLTTEDNSELANLASQEQNTKQKNG